MLIAGVEGEIRFADPAARRWLKQFFGRPPRAGLLPRKVSQWIAKHGKTRAGRSLVAKTSKAQLHLKRERSYTDHNLVLLFELIKGKRAERGRRHRELTPREREVLFWLVRGKSNSDIGIILGIATSTVGKHLERIYPKLGVENRAAATSVHLESDSQRH
jgi:DNA-binding CsgD family transcriptional regulator